MKKLTILLFSIFVSSLISSNAYSLISIKAPSIVEFPQITPINIKLSNSITKGESLNVYIDNNLAYAILPSGNASISYFTGRIRILNLNSTIRVEITKEGVVTEESYSSVSSSQDVAEIPSISDDNKQYKEKFSKNYLRILFKNMMGDSVFIDSIDINTSEGDIKIQLTPYASGCCTSYNDNGKIRKTGGFVGIKGNFDSARVESIHLNK